MKIDNILTQIKDALSKGFDIEIQQRKNKVIILKSKKQFLADIDEEIPEKDIPRKT